MDKDNTLKFLNCLTAIIQEGQVVVKNKVATVSHSDTSNVSLVRCSAAFDVPDGTYGMEFDRLVTAISSAKSKTIEITFDKTDYTVKYEKSKHNFAGLNLATMPSIRPKLDIPFQCIMELDKSEFNDIISTMEKNTNPQKNDLIKVMVSYNGKLLKFRVEEDARNYLEREFELTSVEKGEGQSFKSFYPMDFLIAMNNAIKKIQTETVTLCFGEAMPIMIKAKDNEVDVEYMIAPRIDPE